MSFNKINLCFDINPFNELKESTNFEDVTKGRKGAVLAHIKNSVIPIVRTTTCYNKKIQSFLPVHYDIINKIKLPVNNGLIEIYNNDYTNMGYHSDQRQDLQDDSKIAVFSCYSDSDSYSDSDMTSGSLGALRALRTLRIKNKTTNEENDIIMDHCSVIVFSLDENSKHLHKIILNTGKRSDNVEWLGITFRLSKTLIYFINEIPFFSNNVQLTLATKEQRNDFYKHRQLENKLIEFVYPQLYYTISKSDILPFI